MKEEDNDIKLLKKKKKHDLKSFLDEDDNKPKKKAKKNENKEEYDKINKYTHKEFTDNYFKLLKKRHELPIFNHKKEILNLIDENRVLIIQGETGSGKTTQIPQFLLEEGYNGGIVCTQPRRVAAMSIAKRVSEEMEVELGQQVGYSVRFDDKSSDKTLIKYVTDGMLLKEATVDHDLKKYQIIIIDEAHERTLSTDILFGFIKDLMNKRKELKLIIMSATFDIQKFQEYFDAPLILIKGRTFPVEINYLNKPTDDYFECAIKRVIDIHQNEPEGDILLFLTGEEEIENACAEIRQGIDEIEDEKVGNASVIPIYSTLPPNLQEKIFEPPPKTNKYGVPGRKIIVATNIAESSITIDGIVYVVDPGFAKQKVYNPRGKMESLLVNIISQENADQRAGRAGRTKPGKCFRLYTKESFEKDLKKSAIPEILRANITSVVLYLLKLGVEDLVHFDFIDPPAPETMMRAIEMLNYLGAIDDEGILTELGNKLNQLPLEPELAKCLLKSIDYNCVNDMLTIAATLSVKSPFLRPKNKENLADAKKLKFSHHSGDHITLIMAYNSYKLNGETKNWCSENFLNYRTMKAIENVRIQLKSILVNMGYKIKEDNYDNKIKGDREDNIIKSLIEGYFTQIAHLERGGYYITVKDNQYVFIHPSSYLHGRKPLFVLFNEFVLTSKNYIRTCTEIKPEFLFEINYNYFDLNSMAMYSYKKDLEKVLKEMKKNGFKPNKKENNDKNSSDEE